MPGPKGRRRAKVPADRSQNGNRARLTSGRVAGEHGCEPHGRREGDPAAAGGRKRQSDEQLVRWGACGPAQLSSSESGCVPERIEQFRIPFEIGTPCGMLDSRGLALRAGSVRPVFCGDSPRPIDTASPQKTADRRAFDWQLGRPAGTRRGATDRAPA